MSKYRPIQTAQHPILDTRIEGEEGQPPALSLWDFHEDRSLPNILSKEFSARFQVIISQDQTLYGLDERTLLKRIRHERGESPSVTINRLRMKFWVEYDYAQANNTEMRMPFVYSGICFREQFDHLTRNRFDVAWMLCPPTNYLVVMEEGLIFGIEELRECLALPVVNDKGKVSTPLITAKLQIVQMLENRVKGAIVQRIDHTSKSVSVNLHAKADNPKIADMVAGMSLEEMKGRLEDLRKRKQAVSGDNPLAMPEPGDTEE